MGLFFAEPSPPLSAKHEVCPCFFDGLVAFLKRKSPGEIHAGGQLRPAREPGGVNPENRCQSSVESRGVKKNTKTSFFSGLGLLVGLQFR